MRGKKKTRPNHRDKRYTPAERAKAVARYRRREANGETVLEIAAAIGCSPQSIYNWAAEAKEKAGLRARQPA